MDGAEALRAAGRLRSAELATAQHELRSPLNAILGFADLLGAGKVGPVTDRQREYLGIIANSGRQLLERIDALLGQRPDDGTPA